MYNHHLGLSVFKKLLLISVDVFSICEMLISGTRGIHSSVGKSTIWLLRTQEKSQMRYTPAMPAPVPGSWRQEDPLSLVASQPRWIGEQQIQWETLPQRIRGRVMEGDTWWPLTSSFTRMAKSIHMYSTHNIDTPDFLLWESVLDCWMFKVTPVHCLWDTNSTP